MPTQTQHPWKAVIRTALAYVVGFAVVGPVILGIVQDALGSYIPAEVMAWLAWAVALLVAVSLTVTRIIAIPQVNAWLTQIGLGATPKSDA